MFLYISHCDSPYHSVGEWRGSARADEKVVVVGDRGQVLFHHRLGDAAPQTGPRVTRFRQAVDVSKPADWQERIITTVQEGYNSIICTKALPLIGLTRFTGITNLIINANITTVHFYVIKIYLKECMSDSVTNYNYVGNTKISVSIKKTNANKCKLSEKFLTEILKLLSAF